MQCSISAEPPQPFKKDSAEPSVKQIISKILAGAIALSLLGCGDKREPDPELNTVEPHYRLSGSIGGDVEVYVNGNPVPVNEVDSLLSLFLVNGRNFIEFVGDPAEFEFDVEVNLVTNLFDPDPPSIAMKKKELTDTTSDDTIIIFDAEITDEWSWQEADALGPLTEDDREAIYAIYDEVCAFMESEDFDISKLYEMSNVVPWSKNGGGEAEERFIKMFQDKIPPHSELIFEKVERDETQLLAGKQIVALSSDQGNLVSLIQRKPEKAPEQGEPTWIFSWYLSGMYFVKMNGTWKMLGKNL